MDLKEWTHRYRYKIEHGFGRNIATGKVQVSREMSDDEVLNLACSMSNAIGHNAKIIECELVETR